MMVDQVVRVNKFSRPPELMEPIGLQNILRSWEDIVAYSMHSIMRAITYLGVPPQTPRIAPHFGSAGANQPQASAPAFPANAASPLNPPTMLGRLANLDRPNCI